MKDSKQVFYSKMVHAGSRIYYFDAREDSKGQPYLSISEVPLNGSPNKKRQRVFVHQEDFQKFKDILAEMIDITLEKVSKS